MPAPDDRERLRELQQRLAELAAVMPMTAPAVLDLAVELDRLVNRLMGIGVPDHKRRMAGDPAPCAEDRT